MAHANPEFALGLMRRTNGPVSAEKRDLPTFRDLAGKIRDLEFKIRCELPLTDFERNIWDRYQSGMRHIRRAARMDQSCSLAVVEPPPRVDRPKAGERFVEPKRRLPTDMQAGRVKARRAPVW